MHTADEKKYPNARVLGTYQNLVINDGDLSLSYLWYRKKWLMFSSHDF